MEVAIHGHSGEAEGSHGTNEADDNDMVEGNGSHSGDVVFEPKVGMRFEKVSELIKFYKDYGQACGFRTKIKGVDLKVVPPDADLTNSELLWDEYASRCRLECSKSGKFIPKRKDPRRKSRSIKTGCCAKLKAWRGNDGIWKINKVLMEHNHETLSENSRFITTYREICTRDKGRLITNKLAGIPTNKSYQSLVVEYNGFENTPMLEKDIRNYLDNEMRLRLSEGDFIAMRMYFEDMSKRCKDFLYVYDTTDDGRLRNVFWCDGRSRAAYKDFGDIVSFDTTYLKNRYKMPFAPFIGVNHHGQSILFGCALLSAEDTDNFKWVFDQWKSCMEGKAPTGIITDQCKAIGNAIADIFPDTRHRLCLWHIMQNGNKHLHHLEKWEDIELKLGNVIHNSLTVIEFEHAWSCMLQEFSLGDNKWLREVYNMRDMWVPAYFKDSFWAGMSSTQRSEGMNNFFRTFVNLNSTLAEFAQQFSLALAKRVQDEARETFSSRNSLIQLSTDFAYERIFQELYTSTKFAEVQEQLSYVQYLHAVKLSADDNARVYIVSDLTRKCLIFRPDGVNLAVRYDRRRSALHCECRNFEFRGVLCSHIFKVMFIEKFKYVPSQYVLDRWRKDISRNYLKYTVPHYNPDRQPSEPDTFKLISNKFEEVAHLMLEHKDIMKEYMTVMDKIKAKAIATSTHHPSIGKDELPGIGWVYRRRTTNPASGSGGNTTMGGEGHPPVWETVEDPPDQRGPGPTPTKRKGYRPPPKGGKKRKKQVSTASTPTKGGETSTSCDIGISGFRNPTLRLVQNNIKDSAEGARTKMDNYRSLSQFIRLDIGRGGN